MKKVLVIENNASVKTRTVELLIEEGYNVFNAENGSDGVSNVRKYLPDLIISDVLMPDIDGYTVSGELWNPFQMFLQKN